MAIPQFKQLRRAYGFDEVAIVPGEVTINPDQTNTELKVEDITFTIHRSHHRRLYLHHPHHRFGYGCGDRR